MSAKNATPNPFAKKKNAPSVLDEVIPNKRPTIAKPKVAEPVVAESAQPTQQEPKDEPVPPRQTRVARPVTGKFRTTVDMDRKLNRRVKHYADDLYEIAGGSVPMRDVLEAAIEFAFEAEDAFDEFMKARLK